MTTKWDLDPAVELLDREMPDLGWVFDVSVRELDLQRSCDCVLGQLKGDYWTGLSQVGVSHREAYELGFDIEDDEPREYRRLTKAWRRKLNELREDELRIRARALR